MAGLQLDYTITKLECHPTNVGVKKKIPEFFIGDKEISYNELYLSVFKSDCLFYCLAIGACLTDRCDVKSYLTSFLSA